ncbi:MAG: hypothetical protein HS106_15190 [Ideonella sp.]|nr:hypothetical protein [Ideonella sp.]MBE7427341.1 hypothetical protein [Ideonella sp.]MCC7459377.1 hypothetical protein [Nitrospira sp.]
MNPESKPPPRVLPTLTEIIADLRAEPDAVAPAPRGEAAVASDPLMAAALVNEERIAQRVIEQLQVRVDLLFEHRLRDALAAAVTRVHAALVDDARRELAHALREAVHEAVAEEVKRQRGG